METLYIQKDNGELEKHVVYESVIFETEDEFSSFVSDIAVAKEAKRIEAENVQLKEELKNATKYAKECVRDYQQVCKVFNESVAVERELRQKVKALQEQLKEAKQRLKELEGE